MEALPYRTVDRCAQYLDFIRARVLRITMRIEWLRPFFYHRALRLLSLFALAWTLTLALSLFFPLWVLLIGPLVYGVPHIFSSLRYFHYAVSDDAHGSPRAAYLIGGLGLAAVSAYRLLVSLNIFHVDMPQLSEWHGSTYLELAALIATFVAGAVVYRKALRHVIRGGLILVPLIAAFAIHPLWTIGAMVLIHNFIAFVFWIRSTRTPAERSVAIFSLIAMSLATIAIFLGALDWLYAYRQPELILDFAHLSAQDTGKLIAPWSEQPAFWLHASVAFAFGQGLHYFVWLKAIPDQYHYHETPTSFRQSFSLLSRDFGKAVATALILSSLGAVMIWSFMSFEKARLVYFSLAAFHGYLEIAALALGTKKARLPSLSPKSLSASPSD